MQHRREELVDLIDVADPAPDAAAAMESNSIRSGAIDAVNALEPKLRFVLVAHDLDGIPMAQMAEDAGLPLSTLYKRRTKAIGALRAALPSLHPIGPLHPRCHRFLLRRDGNW